MATRASLGPTDSSLDASAPDSRSDGPKSGVRAAVKPRADRPQSARAQAIRFQATRDDWPAAPRVDLPARRIATPTFGARPIGSPDPTRFSLPAFKPPTTMSTRGAPSDAIPEPFSIDPFSVDVVRTAPPAAGLSYAAGAFLVGVGIIVGVVATLAIQAAG